jgi:4-hydroxybenzoate polyprenyltransferase
MCLLAALLTVAAFHLADLPTSWLVVATIFFIACSSMLQNDWRDRYHDDQKGKDIALRYPRKFLSLVSIFWIIVGGCIVLSFMQNFHTGLALVAIALIGLIYSEVRKIPLLWFLQCKSRQ